MILILVSGKYQVWISNRLCVAEALQFQLTSSEHTHTLWLRLLCIGGPEKVGQGGPGKSQETTKTSAFLTNLQS